MNVIEVVASVAALGNEFQTQTDRLNSMGTLVHIVCDEELRKFIEKVGLSTFIRDYSPVGKFHKARLYLEPKESDGNSLP